MSDHLIATIISCTILVGFSFLVTMYYANRMRRDREELPPLPEIPTPPHAEGGTAAPPSGVVTVNIRDLVEAIGAVMHRYARRSAAAKTGSQGNGKDRD